MKRWNVWTPDFAFIALFQRTLRDVEKGEGNVGEEKINKEDEKRKTLLFYNFKYLIDFQDQHYNK